MSHLLIDKRIHIGRLFFCLALLGACSQEAELKRLTPPHHDRLAREFLTAVRGDDSVSILKQVTPALQVQGFRDTLRLIASSLPAGSIDTLRQVGLTRTRKDGEFRTELIYELHTPSGWGSATIAILEERGIRSVSGFRVNRLPGSIKGTSGFSLSGRSPAHFLVLLLALGCAGLSIVAAVLVAKEKIQRRSLWALFALLGVAPVTLNWATGGVSFQLLSVVLFSAGAVRPGLGGPWLVSVAFPIGAISALRRVRHARAERALARTEAAEPVEISPAS